MSQGLIWIWLTYFPLQHNWFFRTTSTSYSGSTNTQSYSSSTNQYQSGNYSSDSYSRGNYSTADILGSWKHYNLSGATLNSRTTRAKSPLMDRELIRYIMVVVSAMLYLLTKVLWEEAKLYWRCKLWGSLWLPPLQLPQSSLLWRIRWLSVSNTVVFVHAYSRSVCV